MVNTHYMVDGHPIHNKDPYNGYYKSLWTIGWLAPINGYEPWVLTIAPMFIYHIGYLLHPFRASGIPGFQALLSDFQLCLGISAASNDSDT
jgi:hypothetical protein